MLSSAVRSAKILRLKPTLGLSRSVYFSEQCSDQVTSLCRTFTSTKYWREDAPRPASLNVFTDEEQMLRETGPFNLLHCVSLTLNVKLSQVERFATDVVAPKVREMDETENMDPSVIQGLFEQGVSLS